ncbi:hypothetical protein [Derxia lacustris]|uniref:hypothetical protein n=1 Tax=Derxia lacustris TaxID=764842 RepID=UPI000A1706B5|nr:hypothetical protein [Derxia lacustris]
MFEKTFHLTAVAAASLCLMALTACSGGSGSDTSASGTAATAQSATEDTTFAHKVDPAANDVNTEDSLPKFDASVKATAAATVDSTFAAYGEQWFSLRTQNLTVVPGSALDLSGPLSGYNSKSMCANWVLPTAPMPTSAAAATATVDELQRRGFNFVRFHLFESGLMKSSPTGNADIDPVKLDRFFRLAAELSKRGIGYSADVFSSSGGYMAGGADAESASPSGDAKTLINTSDLFRNNWKTVVNKVFNTTNPYLGKPLLQDSSLKLLIGVNENPMAFIAGFSGSFNAAYKPLWNTWLQNKYGSDSAWRSAWAKVSIGGAESLSGGTVNMPPYSPSSKTQREADFAAFIAATETSTSNWQQAYLKGLGYTGKFSQYNVRNSWMEVESRNAVSAVTYNTYNDHPSSYGLGGSIKHASLFDNMFGYLSKAAMLNTYAKPTYLTEVSDVYWNKYRHEAGAVIGAMAAHQDWQGICSFASLTDATTYDTNAYWDRYRAMQTFMVWGDPINVANDRIAAMLFRRGDVSKARYKVGYVVRPDEMNAYKWGATWLMSYGGHFIKRALVNGVELIPPSVTDGNKNWTGPAADAPAEIREPNRVTDDLTPTVRAAYVGSADPTWFEMAARIRESGKIDSTNKTNAPSGIIQSDTNQIYYDIPNQLIDVATPRSEVIVMGERSDAKQDFMNVSRSTPHVTVAAMSLDGANLTASKRILMVHLSNVKGSGMKFSDANEQTVTSWGTFPMLVRGAKTDIQLKLSPTAGWKLYALDLAGNRLGQMWTGNIGGKLGVSLDNMNQWIGPVFYYELVRE